MPVTDCKVLKKLSHRYISSPRIPFNSGLIYSLYLSLHGPNKLSLYKPEGRTYIRSPASQDTWTIKSTPMRICHKPDTVSVPWHFVFFCIPSKLPDVAMNVSISQMRILRLQTQSYTACKWQIQGLPSFEVHVLRFNTPGKAPVVPGGKWRRTSRSMGKKGNGPLPYLQALGRINAEWLWLRSEGMDSLNTWKNSPALWACDLSSIFPCSRAGAALRILPGLPTTT